MKPRCLLWTAYWWSDAQHALRDADTWQSLDSWLERVSRCFDPVGAFIASGSWSEPSLCPIRTIVVNAGAQWSKPFIYNRTNYSCMAVTAAMAFGLNRVKDWDYLILVETDCLIGAIDIPALLSGFALRDELILSPSWCGGIGGPLVIWKPEGAIRMLHHRPYVSFVDDNEPNMPELPEHQWLRIFQDGRLWWNAWPEIPNVRQQAGELATNEEAMTWPVVARPHADIVAPYIAKHLEKAVTL